MVLRSQFVLVLADFGSVPFAPCHDKFDWIFKALRSDRLAKQIPQTKFG